MLTRFGLLTVERHYTRALSCIGVGIRDSNASGVYDIESCENQNCPPYWATVTVGS